MNRTHVKPILFQDIGTSIKSECDDIFKQFAQGQVTSEYAIGYMNALANLATRFQLTTVAFDYVTAWANMVKLTDKNNRIQEMN